MLTILIVIDKFLQICLRWVLNRNTPRLNRYKCVSERLKLFFIDAFIFQRLEGLLRIIKLPRCNESVNIAKPELIYIWIDVDRSFEQR